MAAPSMSDGTSALQGKTGDGPGVYATLRDGDSHLHPRMNNTDNMVDSRRREDNIAAIASIEHHAIGGVEIGGRALLRDALYALADADNVCATARRVNKMNRFTGFDGYAALLESGDTHIHLMRGRAATARYQKYDQQRGDHTAANATQAFAYRHTSLFLLL